MFTGLVEKTARVVRLERRGREASLRLAVDLDDVAIGDSISVSGVCLTATAWRPPGESAAGFDADVSLETLSVTTLGDLSPGSLVNIERSLRVGDRLGGHLVLGHVDGVGTIRESRRVDEARATVVEAPAALARFLAAKGSVTVDGVSLTINRIDDAQRFEMMWVPHTLAVTTLGQLSVGDRVNLEVDVLARYVARQLDVAGSSADRHDASAAREGSLLAALQKSGYVQGR